MTDEQQNHLSAILFSIRQMSNEQLAEVDSVVQELKSDDTKRFNWFFGQDDKYPFLEVYMEGMRKGWTPDQWREAIDKEMAKPIK